MLVTALTIGVIALALILLLNSAIYTQNVASRDLAADENVALTEANTFIEASERLFHEENAQNYSSQTAVVSAYEEGTNRLEMYQRAHELTEATYTGADRLDVSGGYELRQDANGDFISNNNEGDWQIANTSRGLRNTTITVTDLASVTFPENQSFHINLTDGGTTWGLYVINQSGDYNVSTRTDGDSFTHVKNDTLPVTINLTNTSIGSKEYPELEYWKNVAQPYDIEIGNGANATGSYSMIVNTSNKPTSFNINTTDPYRNPVVYSVNGTFAYQSPALNYTRDFRIAPGEPDV